MDVFEGGGRIDIYTANTIKTGEEKMAIGIENS
jgi:hypothetical protein